MRRKHLIILMSLLAPSVVTLWATGEEVTPVTDEELVKLIQSLPNADYLPPRYRLPEGVSPMQSIPEEKRDAVKKYHDNMKELGERYAKLKGYLKNGKSIFDYPGLLAKGKIRYDEHQKRYRMVVGVYDRLRHAGSQGVFGPYRVVFESTGIIIEIKDVVYTY